MPNFEQLQRLEHLPAQIAASIGQQIAAGNIKPGEKLPTEQTLAKSFGVSRSVVREAIAQLRHEGVVDTRQGVGAFVLDPGRRQVIRIESNDLTNPESFRSLFQLRVPLEVEAAGLAALHHTAEDLERMDQTLQAMREMDASWTAETIAADVAFHRALALGTQNEYFTLFVGFIAEKVGSTINVARQRAVLDEIVQVTIAEHQAVRDAVAARDMVGARRAMLAHIHGAASRLSLDLDAVPAGRAATGRAAPAGGPPDPR
ncbi:FadR/GntR family transcriptional regulator [Orrella sp. JC864]|uniref:FadR/GntR family transcriptional regulator n=1 Tax=Orrella sp. JC864 TaxID=3120298 RepID=UPI00300A4637